MVWACGAWLAGLFPDLVSLRVTLQQAVLFRAGPEFAGPGWVDFAGGWYGHGAIAPHGFKVASDADGRDVDPDARPVEATDDAVARAREYLALRFPDLARAPVMAAPACHYSLTEDSNFIFAPRPGMPGQWLLGGGSGHGFKHGPAVAEHVAAVLGGRAEPEERFALGERRPGRSLRTAGSRRWVARAAVGRRPSSAGPGHHGHPGVDRRARAAGGGDRPTSSTPRSAPSVSPAPCSRPPRSPSRWRSGRSSTAWEWDR